MLVIASDLGVLKIAQDVDVDVHLSVQANISNLESLKLLHELGVKRVILSRELSLNEIKELAVKVPLKWRFLCTVPCVWPFPGDVF